MNDLTPPGPTLVLGLGNPIMMDDGVGLAALARLRHGWDLDPAVTLAEGGTWGMNLLPLIEDTGRLVLVDAIRTGAPPGTLVILERDEIPRLFVHKLSPHQIDLREVLALAELRGTLPGEAVALGLEPGEVELGTDLTPAVAARIGDLAAAVAARLGAMGHQVTQRSGAEAADAEALPASSGRDADGGA